MFILSCFYQRKWMWKIWHKNNQKEEQFITIREHKYMETSGSYSQICTFIFLNIFHRISFKKKHNAHREEFEGFSKRLHLGIIGDLNIRYLTNLHFISYFFNPFFIHTFYTHFYKQTTHTFYITFTQ